MSIPTSPQTSPSPEDQNLYAGSPIDPPAMDSTGAVSSPIATATVGAAALPGLGSPPPTYARLRDIWRLLTQSRKVMVGVIIMLFFILVATFGPFFVHGSPNASSNDILLPPSAQHLLGTTQYGQDVFIQVLAGTRGTVFWGLLTSIVITLVAVIVGLTAGYFGGVIDDLLSLLTNIVLVIPAFPLAIVLAAFFSTRSLALISLIIAITGWAFGARVLRAQTMSMRSRDFVEAARASGEHPLRIIFSEILPNELAIVAASFIGTVVYVIPAAVGLEFIGIIDPNGIDWGTMLYWAQNNDALLIGAWWWFLPPGLCVAVLGAALALVNSGIDEIANPRLRHEPKLKVVQTPSAQAAEPEKVVSL